MLALDHAAHIAGYGRANALALDCWGRYRGRELVDRIGVCDMPDSTQSEMPGRYNILFLTTDQTYAHAPRPEGYELPKYTVMRCESAVPCFT